MKRTLFIFGTGGHAKVVADLAESSDEWRIKAFVDVSSGGKTFRGKPVLSEAEWEPEAGAFVVVAIGDNGARQKIVDQLNGKFPEIDFATLIHKSAVVGSGVEIGAGSVVMAGACLNADAIVGVHCVVNTRASLDHDCKIADFATISPGAICGGNVKVGRASWIGLGSSVIEDITIGSNVLVGAGSVVVRSIGDNSVAYGAPCKTVRTRASGDRFLGKSSR